MTARALLAARARRGLLLTLAAMAALVTAGAVTVLGLAAEAGTSPWLVLPLAVIGALAVPAVGHELAVARREEIGLARMRGVHGAGLARFLLVEPLAALVAGTAVGLGLGVLGTWLATRLWLREAAVDLGGGVALAVAGVVGVGLLAVLAGLAGAGREPLADQVGIAARARPVSAAAVFGSILVLVAAAIAVYRSGRGSGTDPDWLVLAGPALVGLAAGQLTVWLLRALARVATARTTTSAVPAFLATRRVGRTADRGSALRLLVAAGAVATLAATGAAGVSAWSADSARLAAGAPLRVDVDTTAQAALAITERLDPNGRWLMAAVLVPDSAPERRRAFVDTERFAAVTGDFFDGTGADDVGSLVGGLARTSLPPLTAEEATVSVDDLGPRPADLPDEARAALSVELEYVGTDGSPGRLDVVLTDAGPVGVTVPLDGCARGCVVRGLEAETGVVFEGDFFLVAGSVGPLRLDLDLGTTDLADRGWRLRGTGGDDADALRTDRGDLVLTTATDGTLTADVTDAVVTLPVLAAGGVSWDGGPRVVDDPSGQDHPAELRERLPALPLVGGTGLLGDLRTALYAAGPTVPLAEVTILAAADTPPAVIDALTDDGGTLRRLGDVEAAGVRASGAVQASVYAVMAGCCLLVALLALLAAGARQRAAYRLDVAALRVVGVPTRQIRAAGRGELGLLAVIAVVAGVGAGLLAARLLLADLPLVEVPEFAVPLRPVSSVLPALGTGLLLAVIVVTVGGRGRRLDADATRPAILRAGQGDGRG